MDMQAREFKKTTEQKGTPDRKQHLEEMEIY